MKRKICNAVAVLGMVFILFFVALLRGNYYVEKEKESLRNDEDCVNKEPGISVIKLQESEISKSEVPETEIPEVNFVKTEETDMEALETEMPADGIEQIKKLQEEGIENIPEELPVWEGRYTFHEVCPPIYPDGLYVGMDYDIEIYQDEQEKYCADVKIKGYQTSYFFRANVYGNSGEIHLYFKESLFEDRAWGWPRSTINLEEEIMSFVRNENARDIYTTLGQLEGMELLNENVEAGGIYLDKVE